MTIPVVAAAEHARTVPDAVEPHQPSGFVRERVGCGHVDDDVDEAARRDRERHRGREHADVRCERLDREHRTPDDQRPGEGHARAPTVGEDAADRSDRGGRDDAGREQDAELGVGEVERPLDVDRGNGERPRVEAEDQKAGGNGFQRRTHTAVSRIGFERRPGSAVSAAS